MKGRDNNWKHMSQLLYGGDYNPDQWLAYPEILEEDMRLMKLANINCVSLGIFAWSSLEPEEGCYEFGWLESIINKLYENGIYVILATPTAAMPQWMTEKYPEVMQVEESGIRNLPGKRHNFCASSPVMRDKMRQINQRLAQRFGKDPAVIAWHVSNEYGGNRLADAACHCEYCQENFREWLKKRYKTLDALNEAWWNTFWSHTYTSWEQIKSPSVRGESLVYGLNLDWKRFVSDQMLDFCKEEISVLRQYSKYPVTTNMMGFFKPINYFDWAKELDVISWDCYGDWHGDAQDDMVLAVWGAATHSMMRSLKKAPFLMMESTPSLVNYRSTNALKRPGVNELSSLQAVAHGSNSVQYFQWRKGRGGCEQFHGAVVDHKNGENTRVFRDVSILGERLKKLSDKICSTINRPKVAMIFDWENMWAIEDVSAVRNNINYREEFLDFYRPLWEMGIEVDIIDMDSDLAGYEVVIAPFNYMYRGDYIKNVTEFVEKGGCYITNCWSGEVNESTLCFLKEHPLRNVLGIRTEEVDVPGKRYDNEVIYHGKNYSVTGIRALVHAESAEILAEYQKDFYQGYPALTKNRYGKGTAYFIASENEWSFVRQLYQDVLEERNISCGFNAQLPEGVSVTERKPLEGRNVPGIWFLQNFNEKETMIDLQQTYRNLETDETLSGAVKLPGYSVFILEEV